MWKSVVALRIHLVCRPPKAGTRISLQENMYVETDAQLTLKVIYKLLWTHAACSGAGTLTWIVQDFCIQWCCFQEKLNYMKKLCVLTAKLVDMRTHALHIKTDIYWFEYRHIFLLSILIQICLDTNIPHTQTLRHTQIYPCLCSLRETHSISVYVCVGRGS